jgi:hypothetical protein
MFGQFLHWLEKKVVDLEQPFGRLIFGDVKGETESTVVTAQDQ